MTVTRHDVSAATFLEPLPGNPPYGDGYFPSDGFPVWADPLTSTAGWFNNRGTMTLTTATDPEGRTVLVQKDTAPSTSQRSTTSHSIPLLAPGFYRLSARVYNPTGVPVRAWLGVSMNDATVTPIATGGEPLVGPGYIEVWRIIEVIGTPTGCWARFEQVNYTDPGAPTTLRWSDFTITPTSYVPVLDLRPTDVTITLDESWTPYARATLTCPAPQTDILDRIDPRRSSWVRLRLTQATAEAEPLRAIQGDYPAAATLGGLSTAFAAAGLDTLGELSSQYGAPYNPGADVASIDQVREARLLMRTRSVDYVTGTMTIELTSGEAALMDLARYEDLYPLLEPPATSSLAYLVGWALRLFGWALSGTVTDAPIDQSTVAWEVGQSLWDFLDAHVRAAGLRLWCDERGRWHLTPPHAGISGLVSITRPTGIVDTLSRDADDWADVVCVIYEWTNSAGAQQKVTRWAGEQPATGRVELPRTLVQRWRTPGTFAQAYDAAIALQERSKNRGRPLQVSAVSDYRVTPGAALDLPAGLVAPLGTAMVSAVTWTWPDDEMTIRTRDASTEG